MKNFFIINIFYAVSTKKNYIKIYINYLFFKKCKLPFWFLVMNSGHR